MSSLALVLPLRVPAALANLKDAGRPGGRQPEDERCCVKSFPPDQLRSIFGAGIAPLELPIGEETEFRGVADLLTDTAITYADGSATTGEIPAEMEALEHQVHDNLVEGIVVADDDLMERYLDGDIPSPKELEETLAHGVASAQVFPVVCGSASKEVAIDRLAAFICEIGPSPLDRPGVKVKAGDKEHEVKPDPNGEPLAYVWKTVADPYVGRVSLMKVLSGTIRPDNALTNPRSHTDEKLHALFALRGKEHENLTDVPAGDLFAVAKLSDTTTGDTLAPKGTPVSVAPTATIEPLDRGEGFEFVDKIVGGAIPRQFIPAVEKGILETMSMGGVFGYPVVDVRVTLVDGKFHSVDSSEMSFKMAGSLGFREGMAKANPVLLEPISLLEVTVPLAYQGDVMGDLNSRRGRVQGTEPAGIDEQTITALVPTSEILRYAIDLRSLTGGRGRFKVEHDHYDLMPSHLVDKVAKAGEEAKANA